MKRFTTTLIILLLTFSTLFAQQINADRVRLNIEQLQRKMGQVDALAKKYNDAQAVALLDKARNELLLASNKYQDFKNTPETQIARRKLLINLAKAHFKLAGKYVDAASRLLLFKPAAQMKKELDNLIRKAEHTVSRSTSDEGRYFLSKSRKFQSDAQSSFRNGRFLKGYEFLRISMYFAQKTIELASASGQGRNDEQNFRNAENNIRALLQQASSLSAQNRMVSQMYQSARNYVDQARSAYRAGDFKKAFARLRLAERLLFRVVDMADSGSSSDKQQARENLQSLGRYLQSLPSDMQSPTNPFIDKANKLYQRAAQQINAGAYKKANVSMQLSQRMALKAYRENSALDGPDSKDQLKMRLTDAKRLFDLQESHISEAGKAAKLLHRQAGKFLGMARGAYQHNALFRMRYLLNISLKLMNQARKSIANENDQEQIKQNLQRLKDILNRLNKNAELSEKWRIKISVLTDLLSQAQTAFKDGNYGFAGKLSEMVQNQLTVLLKRN